MHGHHLRAKADAEIRLVVAQRHTDPVDLALDEIFVVVGALRAAENHRAGVAVHRLWQRVAEPWPADVERKTELRQSMSDATGRRIFLMENEEDRLQHIRVSSAML